MNLHTVKLSDTHQWSAVRYATGWADIIRRNEAIPIDNQCYGYVGVHYCIAAFDALHGREQNRCVCTHARCGHSLNIEEGRVYLAARRR